jgi:tetratricopeptide (TPR) repeat protein
LAAPSSDMKMLEPPDTHFVSAAVGWIELGNLPEAKDQLRQVSEAAREHPMVLKIWWHIHVEEKDWVSGLRTAEAIVKSEPDSSFGWLHRAYALRRVPDGGLIQAREALLSAHEKFPEEAIIPYNLSCYACQLNDLDEARTWFRRAMELGEPDKLKQLALDDDDLRPLWDEIRKM